MKNAGLVAINAALTGATPDVPIAFGAFEDKLRYAGKSPEAAYLITLAVVLFRGLDVHVRTRMMMICGSFFRGDMTFKHPKKCMVDGLRPFEAEYAVMNEFGQILGSYACRTKSLEQVCLHAGLRIGVHTFRWLTPAYR